MAAESGARGFAIHWSALPQWDVPTANLTAGFKPNFPLYPLGAISKVRRELATDFEIATGLVKMVERVSFDGIIFAGGKDSTKMDQWIARPGDLLISKIRARQGSVGLVSAEMGPVSATTHYRSLVPDLNLFDPIFAWLLLRSEYCRAQFLAATGGAMKGEISEENLLSLKMPLPPLDTQRAIVSKWQALQTQIKLADDDADQREVQGQQLLLKGLGLQKRSSVQSRKCFALKWSAIGRWGTETNQPDTKLDVSAGHYPVTTLATVILDLANGWSPKCLDRPAEGNEWGVVKLGAVSYGAFDPTANKGLPSSLTPQPALEIKTGDWLISRANITRLVGACALVGETPPRLILCDKIFRAVWRPNSPVLPAYLDEVIKTPHLRQQIEASLTGTSPTMKNISKPALLALRLPLPPLDVQQTMIAAIGQARAHALVLRQQAKQLREQAKREIEVALLGRKDLAAKQDQ